LSVGVVLHAEFVVLQQLYVRIRTPSPTVNLRVTILSASTSTPRAERTGSQRFPHESC
jgi:hypothetical protein